MRVVVGAAVAAFLASASIAEAEDKCYSEEAVVSEMKASGAMLGERLNQGEIASFTAKFAPPPPEVQIERMSAVQIWIRHDWAVVVFFDEQGCASATGSGPADELMKAAGNIGT
jgi:hypothetical protein